MLSEQLVTLLLLLLILSIPTHETPLFLICLALLVAAIVSKLWERYALARVEYRRWFTPAGSTDGRSSAAPLRVDFGEEVDLHVEVINRKILPLAWLEMDDEMPADLEVVHRRTQPSYKSGRALLASLFAMRPYERVRRRYTIRCTARGEHLFGPARLRSGDLFGFALCDRIAEPQDALIVYPRIVPLHTLGLPARHPLGDMTTQSWIFEDPSRVAGAREYRQGDSLRRIHWPATARSGQLHSRLYEATTSHKLAVFLNVSTDDPSYPLQPPYASDPAVLEFSIMVAASVAAWGFEQGYQVGLYTNGLHRGARAGTVVEPGRGPEQLERMLVALARLQPDMSERFVEFLAAQARALPIGTTAVVVSSGVTAPAEAALGPIRAGGHAVVVLQTSRRPGTATSLSVRQVGPPDEWRTLEAVRA